MNHKILLLTTIFVLIDTNCMEQKTEPTPICYLEQIPFDIQNHIVHFLYETHEEFIKRTFNTLKKIINQSAITPLFQYCQFLEIDTNEIKRGFWSYSPDEAKIAYLNDYYIQKTLTIIDIQKKKEGAILCDTKIDIKYPTAIALSNEATMIAAYEVRRHYQNSYSIGGLRQLVEIWREERVLEIRKLATQASLETPLLSSCECYLIAFNKQGTHVVLYLVPDKYQDCKNMHLKIFSLKDKENLLDIPLKDAETVKNIIEEKKLSAKHTLQDFFISRGICKSIVSSIDK